MYTSGSVRADVVDDRGRGIEMVVIREDLDELYIRAHTDMLIRVTLCSTAGETYRIKGLVRNQLTAGRLCYNRTAPIPSCALRTVGLHL